MGSLFRISDNFPISKPMWNWSCFSNVLRIRYSFCPEVLVGIPRTYSCPELNIFLVRLCLCSANFFFEGQIRSRWKLLVARTLLWILAFHPRKRLRGCINYFSRLLSQSKPVCPLRKLALWTLETEGGNIRFSNLVQCHERCGRKQSPRSSDGVLDRYIV